VTVAVARDLLSRRGATSLAARPGGALLAHLDHAAALPAGWDTSEVLVAVGQCFAACATDGFDNALLDLAKSRPGELIRADAETIVRRYAICDRKRHLSGAHCWRHHRHRPVHRRGHRAGFRELQAFLSLSVASELDIAANSADWDREGWAQLVARFDSCRRRSASERGSIITTTEPRSAKDFVPPPRS
jgi:hypothetical protein